VKKEEGDVHKKDEEAEDSRGRGTVVTAAVLKGGGPPPRGIT